MDAVRISTTQNIDIQYRLAGIFQRVFAFIIDLMVIIVFSIFYSVLVISHLPNRDMHEYSIYLLVIINLLYPLLSETFVNGQTLGKLLLEIRVVKVDGSSPTFSAYLLRWLLNPFDFGLVGSVAFVSIMVTQKGQRLGDLLAGTTVIKKKQARRPIISQAMKQTGTAGNYTPVFAEVYKLTDKEIRLARKSIITYKEVGVSEPAKRLAEKIKEKLQVESELPPLTFLQTVIKDYYFISSQNKSHL